MKIEVAAWLQITACLYLLQSCPWELCDVFPRDLASFKAIMVADVTEEIGKGATFLNSPLIFLRPQWSYKDYFLT